MTVDIDPDRTAIVAMYGPKPEPLAELITSLQSRLKDALAELFAPRPLGDAHSTIIGLDVHAAGAPTRNVPHILQFLFKEFQRAPFTVQYGGYDPQDKRLLSRGTSLYERSLTINGDKVVLIGWPVLVADGSRYTATQRLANIRRTCEQFGVRHKYHADPTVDDPDSYIVIGKIKTDEPIDHCVVQQAASHALEVPTRVVFDERHVSVVQYVDFALPHATSDVWSLQEALETT